MYQAIVLLPLLGAILAGIIAMAGARARHPGGSPVHGAEDHAHDLAAGRHGSGAPSGHGDASVLYHPHHEPIDHGEAHQPPAQGSRAAELITCTLLVFAAILSWIALVRVGYQHQD